MKTLKDIFGIYNKFKPAIIIGVCTLLLFLSTLWSPLIYVLYVFTFLFYLTCNFGEFLCFTMYFEMFSGILPYFLISVCIGFVINIGRYIYDLVKKRVKFYLIPFVITIAIIVIFSAIHYNVDNIGIEQGILFISLFIGVYLAFVYRKEINFKKCFEYLSIGIIASIFVSLLFYAIPSCKSLVDSREGLTVMSLKNYIFTTDMINNRLKLLTYHTNHLAMICMFMITYVIYALLNFKNKNKFQYIYFAAIFVVSSVLGFLTLSKAFIVMFLILMLYSLICFVIRFKKKSIYFIVPILILCVILGIIFKNKIVETLKRFSLYGGSFLDDLTSGRTTIWKKYFESIGSSFAKLAFGHGLFNQNIVPIGSHNIFIELLYRLGIVGVIAFIALIVFYYLASDRKIHFTYRNCLLLMVFLIFGLEEMILSERFIFFLILAIMMLVKEEEDSTETIEANNIENDKNITEENEKINANENVNLLKQKLLNRIKL